MNYIALMSIILCIQHRKCSRTRPCSLDMLESDAYWLEVERFCKLAKIKSTRRSNRGSDTKSRSKT